MSLIAHINQQRLVDTFIEFAQINSPSFGEKELGEVLIRKLEQAGCRVEKREYEKSFNLIAYKKGAHHNTSPLLLSGHMDTIESTAGIDVKIENDIIRTDGNTILGADNKSALAQIIEAVTVLEERDIHHGDIEILFTSAEEKGLYGIRNLDFSGLQSRYALVLDSSGDVGRMVIAAPTHHTYEMRISGKSAHAGIEPERGINAIKIAAKIIAEAPDGRIDEVTTANIGVIQGGTATNVVAKETLIHGEVRSHSPETLEKTKETIFETARKIAKNHEALINISNQEEYRAFTIEKDEPFVRYLEEIFNSCGIEPKHIITGGGSDANMLNQNGITTINISTGMKNVHSPDEQIHINELVKGCLVVLTSIKEFGEFLKNKNN